MNNYTGAPWVIKFVYLCIQEIFVVKKSRERTSVRMLAEYDMSHFRFGVQGISNLLILILGIYVNWEWSKKGIRKPLLHNCIAGLGVDVIFFKVLRSPVMFSINRRLRFIFF